MIDISELWRMFRPRLLRRAARGPISDARALAEFVSTRAAFIAQKSLYGYLKARMGTSFPRMFEDDHFAASINLAKMHYYSACLADLAVFAAANALHGCPAGDEERERLATALLERGLADNQVAVDGFDPAAARAQFRTRLLGVDWRGGARTADAFSASPAALVRWAPIVKAHKDMDREYVMNSVRFAWIDIRRELLRRLDAAGLCRAVRAAPAAASAGKETA